MEIKLSRNNDDMYLLELSGSLDLYSANQLKDLVMKIISKKAERFIIDLSKVDNVNSSGIGALIFVSSTLKKLQCPLVIIVSEGPVLTALEVTRLKNYFSIAPSLKEALSMAAK